MTGLPGKSVQWTDLSAERPEHKRGAERRTPEASAEGRAEGRASLRSARASFSRLADASPRKAKPTPRAWASGRARFAT